MINGIGRLLNVSTTFEQKLECHKALVLSQQRMLAYMNEIQRQQQNLLEHDKNKYDDLVHKNLFLFYSINTKVLSQQRQQLFYRIFVYH